MGDKKIQSFGKAIMKITPEIRERVTALYMDGCYRQHCIAFMQWRYNAHDTEKLSEMIDMRNFHQIKLIESYNDFKASIIRSCVENTSTKKSKYSSIEWAVKQQMAIPLDKKRMHVYYSEPIFQNEHLINSPEMIGWPDMTFEKEKKSDEQFERQRAQSHFLTEVDDNSEDRSHLHRGSGYRAYPDHRYQADSPRLLYIPTDEVLVKIMRACCHLSSPDDLIYNTPISWRETMELLALGKIESELSKSKSD